MTISAGLNSGMLRNICDIAGLSCRAIGLIFSGMFSLERKLHDLFYELLVIQSGSSALQGGTGVGRYVRIGI
jgi:hypothetical protein